MLLQIWLQEVERWNPDESLNQEVAKELSEEETGHSWLNAE